MADQNKRAYQWRGHGFYRVFFLINYVKILKSGLTKCLPLKYVLDIWR